MFGFRGEISTLVGQIGDPSRIFNGASVGGLFTVWRGNKLPKRILKLPWG
jgi:hypothetical protein